MYDALTVARYVINYSNCQDYVISNLKLQKILYFIQAYFLIIRDKACFSDAIEAWDFGPVVPSVYQEFKQYGAGNIPAIRQYTEGYGYNAESKLFDSKIISRDDKNSVECVVEKFKDYSATDLVKLTHAQDPWKDAYRPYENNIISLESIRNYFNE